MASKKKPQTKKIDAVSTVDEDGFLCLQGDRLWKWRALDAELRVAVAELESVKLRIQTEVAKNTELRDLLSKQAGLLGTISTAKAEYERVQKDIEAFFGLDLKECSFDDKTGRLYNLTAEGQRGEPLKPRRKKRANHGTA